MSKRVKTDNLELSLALISWYRANKRALPWRLNRDPYRIWISEVMLQQTTVAAVIPFFERFMAKFPSVSELACAPLQDVLEQWAGLGYYSRAKNLHRTAQILAASGFPKSSEELLVLPGFGPYTSRAVASLAFDERSGVLDGNVIRVLSRLRGSAVEYWKPSGRAELQDVADQLAQVDSPSDLNQGLMELGATICTSQRPACLLCPWSKRCVAKRDQKQDQLPLKKPRRLREVWQWSPLMIQKQGRVLLIANDYAPFLKGHWLLPGTVERLKKAPKKFDYKGTVTHHDIYVSVREAHALKADLGKSEKRWVKMDELKKEIPASLIRKAIELGVGKC